MNKLDKLTWKYFWEQKKEEIGLVLGFLFICVSVIGLISQFGWMCKNQSDDCGQVWGGVPCECKVPYEPILPRWIMHTGFVTTGIWIIIGLHYWISTNWNKARERAEVKLKGG